MAVLPPRRLLPVDGEQHSRGVRSLSQEAESRKSCPRTWYDVAVDADAQDPKGDPSFESDLLAAIIEGTDEAVVSMRLDGTILTWNPAAERIYGWSATESIGRNITLIVPENRRSELQGLIQEISGGSAVHRLETQRATKGGTTVDVALTLSPVYGRDGTVVGASAIARDITEQRWMASTLDTTLQQLEMALSEARASEERSRQFLADAAHQLRTPMAGIQACAEALLRGTQGEERDRLLATMVRETSRAARLVSGLLQMARLDEGQSLTLVAHDVSTTCRTEVERVGLLSPSLSVALVERTKNNIADVDPHALQEVLANLLDNARRHAHSRIEVSVDSTDEQVLIRVIDDGPGLALEDRGRVFERFASLDGRGGSGLGLTIARGLARAMGGDVDYVNGFVLTVRRSI